MENVTFKCIVDKNEAYALAELCKRIGFHECQQNAVDDIEARRMISALEKVRGSLTLAGVSVR